MKLKVTVSMWDLFSVGIRERNQFGPWVTIWSGDKRNLRPRIFNNRVDIRADRINYVGREKKLRGKK
jgi:hypothetical protein